MTADDLTNYYVQLLVMEYFGRPKASGTVEAFASAAVADLIVMQVRAGFALSTATGRQLDALGQLLGLQRSVPGFLPGTPDFAMPSYTDAAAGTYIGLARYAGAAPTGHWARYSDSPTSYVMTDGQFSQLIQFVIAARASNCSLQSLANIFYQFFGPLVTITDNLNMTMTYTHNATSDPSQLFAILNYLGLLPNPAGVQAIVVSI